MPIFGLVSATCERTDRRICRKCTQVEWPLEAARAAPERVPWESDKLGTGSIVGLARSQPYMVPPAPNSIGWVGRATTEALTTRNPRRKGWAVTQLEPQRQKIPWVRILVFVVAPIVLAFVGAYLAGAITVAPHRF
jgi:hypothetical protein